MSNSRFSFLTSTRLISLILLGIILIRFGTSLHSSPVVSPPHLNQSNDAESKLALGQRLKLEACDVFALELIPGISDTLAFKMVEKRSTIAETAQYLSHSSKHRALEIIHGIGKKTAQKLNYYLEVNSGSSLLKTSSAEIRRMHSLSRPGHSRRKQGAQPISALKAKSSIPKGATRKGSVGPKRVI